MFSLCYFCGKPHTSKAERKLKLPEKMDPKISIGMTEENAGSTDGTIMVRLHKQSLEVDFECNDPQNFRRRILLTFLIGLPPKTSQFDIYTHGTEVNSFLRRDDALIRPNQFQFFNRDFFQHGLHFNLDHCDAPQIRDPFGNPFLTFKEMLFKKSCHPCFLENVKKRGLVNKQGNINKVCLQPRNFYSPSNFYILRDTDHLKIQLRQDLLMQKHSEICIHVVNKFNKVKIFTNELVINLGFVSTVKPTDNYLKLEKKKYNVKASISYPPEKTCNRQATLLYGSLQSSRR